MRCFSGRIAVIGFSVLALLLCTQPSVRVPAQFQAGEGFSPQDAVETITVQIKIGADGQDVNEPVALDLGLGFPLWLHPLGRAEGETAVYGAVPQRADLTQSARANSTASCTFARSGDAGQDVLRTSSQLLAGVRVGDISRIGFMSRGDSAWVLGAYKIQINGREFAKNLQVNAAVAALQQTARGRLAEIDVAQEPLEHEAENLRTLVTAGLATDDDQARLAEIEQALLPLAQERTRLDRQLEGSFPWYQDTGFTPVAPAGAPVQSLRVTAITAAHTGAGTRNYVYYRTGGHKYLLSSPLQPLEPERGLQVFQLDLVGGPLTAGDMRGHAWGMLAHAEPYGTAPDRWHPQRLLVEVDGRVVYDSDENERDRQSLSAIRLIPPAHYDAAGAVVEDTPIARETYVWEAGQGQGLDQAQGGAAAFPAADDPTFPQPELGLEDEAAEDLAAAGQPEGFDEGFQPFPGEQAYDPSWDVVVEAEFEENSWGPPGFSGGSGGVPGWVAPPSWGDVIGSPWSGLADAADDLLDLLTGDASGDPVQVQHVRLVNDAGMWEVHWDVWGDASQVTGYLVEIVVLLPHEAIPLGESFTLGTTAAGDREMPVPAGLVGEAEAWLAANGDDTLWAYLLPRVTPQGDDFPGMAGAARALTDLRGDPSAALVPLPDCEVVDGGAGVTPLALGEQNVGSAAWLPGACLSHTGYTFDVPIYGAHTALRLDPTQPPGAERIHLPFRGVDQIQGQYRIVGHVGYIGLPGAPNTVDSRIEARITDGWGIVSQEVNEPGVASVDARLRPFAIDLDTEADFGVGVPVDLQLVLEIVNNAITDPQQPAAVFGLRVIHVGP